MAKEIERKFLIKRELWQPQRPGVEIRQGYLSLDPERTVRVRTKGAKGYLTIKGKNQGISRTELEYEIPYEEASQMLEELCLHPLVEKTRYLEQHGQQLWEIDIFAGDNQWALAGLDPFAGTEYENGFMYNGKLYTRDQVIADSRLGNIFRDYLTASANGAN